MSISVNSHVVLAVLFLVIGSRDRLRNLIESRIFLAVWLLSVFCPPRPKESPSTVVFHQYLLVRR
jgi:hypothetical protein